MREKIVALVVLVAVSVAATNAAWAYDESLAKSYEKYFAPFSGKATGKTMQMIKPPDFVAAVQEGENLFVLDVRTPAETGIYGITIPGSVVVPMDQVFTPENLARIPIDKKVVVVCKGGHRAVAVATGLRHVGFSNVYVLKNGTEALVDYLNPKTAY
jgi:rhodanese-related sulfurtransferase